MKSKCPCCGWVLAFQKSKHPVVPDKYQCEKVSCWFGCNAEDLPRISAAMEFASATRFLEDAMEPLNSGKLKMGEALPRIRLAMEHEKACEHRVLEAFESAGGKSS